MQGQANDWLKNLFQSWVSLGWMHITITHQCNIPDYTKYEEMHDMGYYYAISIMCLVYGYWCTKCLNKRIKSVANDHQVL